MPTRFATTAAAIIDPLIDLHRELNHVADACHRHCDELHATTDALVSGSDAFLGVGATAFGSASTNLVSDWRGQLGILDEIVYQTQRCITALQLATEEADGRYVNNYVQQRMLEALSAATIVTEGAEAVDSVGASVALDITNALNAGEHWLAGILDGGAQILATLVHLGTILVDDVWNAMLGTVTIVRTWAAEIFDCTARWTKHMGSQLDALTRTAPVASDYAMPPGVVAAMLSMHYQTHPIQIQLIQNADGTKTIFVTLAGTEGGLFDVNRSNSVLSYVLGAFGAVSPYGLDVLGDVKRFIAQNKAQFNGTTPTVVIAGHSQGGVVAQALAHLGGANGFNVRDIMLFDAPTIGPMGVSHQDYATSADLIPYASRYMLAPTHLTWDSAKEIANQFLHTAVPGAVNPFTGAQTIPDPGRSLIDIRANHMDLVSPPAGTGANPNWKAEQQWFQEHPYAPVYSGMQPITTMDYDANGLGILEMNPGIPVAPDAPEREHQ